MASQSAVQLTSPKQLVPFHRNGRCPPIRNESYSRTINWGFEAQQIFVSVFDGCVSVTTMSDPGPLRFGILGAAAIAPAAMIRPARATPGVEVTSIAARDPARARAFAERHGIARVASGYQELLDDPTIDAVYIPLPNSLHGIWTQRAVEAGKHVLCEKPFAANAVEAAQVSAAADASGRVVMEAFHWRYHPLTELMIDIVTSGELGEIHRLEAAFCFPLLKRHDIRWSASLAGGSLLDAGCYAVNQIRTLGVASTGSEPTVTHADATRTKDGVDANFAGSMRFDDGPSATMRCGFRNFRHPLNLHLIVSGSKGDLRAFNPIAPHILGHLRIRAEHGRRTEWADRTPSYTHQLHAFVAAIHDGLPFPSTASDAVKNMQVIDDLFRAAGMTPPTGSSQQGQDQRRPDVS